MTRWKRLSQLIVIHCGLLLSILLSTTAATTQYVEVTTDLGTFLVPDDRKPSLYTQDFGDCLGYSAINVTRFDAAYYKDNMTVLFHLEGHTNMTGESVMMYIGVYAYGVSQFNLVFNPCHAQIYSLCPMNASVPIEANGVIPVSQSDVASIPAVALTIPDFEGQAILRIFSNSSRTEIGCYSGVVSNGATFSHPTAIGIVLGLFVLAACAASFVTSIRGTQLSTIRTHYAHSISAFVVFAILQHIYFSGALSMNWPSVLVAFWDNFAWAGGMIYSKSMQNSINQLVASNHANLSIANAPTSNATVDVVGGGFQLSSIYPNQSSIVPRGSLSPVGVDSAVFRHQALYESLVRRSSQTHTDDASWYGSPVAPGLPLPGNYSGFAGSLSMQGIPASNAFLTGFLWFLILMVAVACAIATMKGTLTLLDKRSPNSTKQLQSFKPHWVQFIIQAELRILFIGFFALMLLIFFQFDFHTKSKYGSPGITAIASLVFIAAVGMLVAIIWSVFYDRLQPRSYEIKKDRLLLLRRKLLGCIPCLSLELESSESEKASPSAKIRSLTFSRPYYLKDRYRKAGIHQDDEKISQFGWLTARYRRTKWWFFAPWLLYEFVRAGIYGAGIGHPMAQVTGLLVVEVIAMVVMMALRPFESQRLNALMVYLLGFSKISTLALSSAFNPRYNISRINTTIIGIVIITIQGFLVIAMMIVIAIGVVSSYMSFTRDSADFKPRSWAPLRQRYFRHLEDAAPDLPPSPPPEPPAPSFRVTSVARYPRIEDGTTSTLPDGTPFTSPYNSRSHLVDGADSPAASILPFGAQVHRASWSTNEFKRTSAIRNMHSSRHTSYCSTDTRHSPCASRGRTGPCPLDNGQYGQYGQYRWRSMPGTPRDSRGTSSPSPLSRLATFEESDDLVEMQRVRRSDTPIKKGKEPIRNGATYTNGHL